MRPSTLSPVLGTLSGGWPRVVILIVVGLVLVLVLLLLLIIIILSNNNATNTNTTTNNQADGRDVVVRPRVAGFPRRNRWPRARRERCRSLTEV